MICQKISAWFNNYAKPAPKPSKKGKRKDPEMPTRYKKNYTVRDAIIALHRDRIKELAMEKAGVNAGKGDFLGKYGRAVDEVTKELSREQKKEAIDLAADWNENGLSRDVQLLCAFVSCPILPY